MAAARRITVAQRRARLVARHHLARTAADPLSCAQSLVAIHSSDPITPYLAVRARVPHFEVGDLDRALYDDRTLWRLHAMRRTLFVVPAAAGTRFIQACARDVAAAERRKVEGWLRAALDEDPRPRLADLEARTLAALSDGVPRRTQELSAAVEGLTQPITVGSGKWTATAPLSSRLLFLLAIEGHITRGRPAGSWVSSQYRWVNTVKWFDGTEVEEILEPRDARRQLAQAYLRSHGPATATDVKWWTGWTVRATQAALSDAGAVEVDLEEGGTAWLLADDLHDIPDPLPSLALLPGLDPTVMGWKDRDWYLGDLAPHLFDRNGNAGPTVWVDGCVVGGWGQRPNGEVVTTLLKDVGADARARVADEAAALMAWFDGVVVTPRFRTPLEQSLSG